MALTMPPSGGNYGGGTVNPPPATPPPVPNRTWQPPTSPPFPGHAMPANRMYNPFTQGGNNIPAMHPATYNFSSGVVSAHPFAAHPALQYILNGGGTPPPHPGPIPPIPQPPAPPSNALLNYLAGYYSVI